MAVPCIVIIGAGFGGLSAARALRKIAVTVKLIDRSNHHLFQPLLYQVATASLSPAHIATPIRSVLAQQKNIDILLAEVTGVDKTKRQISCKDHRPVSYDTLVVATGAQHSYFGHPEWEAFAPGLKSIPDATHIRQKVLMAFEQAEMAEDPSLQKQFLRFILVGGGPTGVEMAGAIAELAHRALASDFRRIDPTATEVILIEAGPRILPSFHETLSLKATQSLERLGVRVLTSTRVSHIDGEGVLAGTLKIPSKVVIWTAGVKASRAAEWLETPMDPAGRVIVEPTLTLPHHPEIFVIGDTALVKTLQGTPLPGLAPVAMQEGRYVARAIQNRLLGKPIAPFEYRDKGNLATIGRASAVAQLKNLRLTGLAAWLAWVFVHIYYLIGFRNRVLVMFEWAWAYVTFQRGARLILTRGFIL